MRALLPAPLGPSPLRAAAMVLYPSRGLLACRSRAEPQPFPGPRRQDRTAATPAPGPHPRGLSSSCARLHSQRRWALSPARSRSGALPPVRGLMACAAPPLPRGEPQPLPGPHPRGLGSSCARLAPRGEERRGGRAPPARGGGGGQGGWRAPPG